MANAKFDWHNRLGERGVEYLSHVKQEGPSRGSSDSKNVMLISEAVQEFVGNKARRSRPDDDANELDCMPALRRQQNLPIQIWPS